MCFASNLHPPIRFMVFLALTWVSRIPIWAIYAVSFPSRNPTGPAWPYAVQRGAGHLVDGLPVQWTVFGLVALWDHHGRLQLHSNNE